MRTMPGPDKHRPCWRCMDRKTGDRETDCHQTCKEYIEYAAEVRKKKEFVIRENGIHEFPPSVKYKKSSGRYVTAKRGIHS